MTACRCQFCSAPLEPVQEFRYLVETATVDEPVQLERIRTLPSADGRPLRVCRACQDEMRVRPAPFRRMLESRGSRSGMLAAAGFLSLAWFFAAVVGDA